MHQNELLVEAEQNETLSRRPNTEHVFWHFFFPPSILPSFFLQLHKLNSQNVIFTVFSFNQNQLQNNNLKIST